MTGKDITDYIHDKELAVIDDDGCAPHLIHDSDPELPHVMYVEDVCELAKEILQDEYENLKYVNQILDANNKMLQDLLRKDGKLE